MADRFQILISATWNNVNIWSASTGGAGGASVPGILDTAIFDGSSDDQALDADLGTVSATLGDYSASTEGVNTIDTTGYGGIFDLDTSDAVIGSGGLTLAAGEMQGGTGTLVVRGNIDGTGGTWTDDASLLVIDGGTVGTPLTLTAFPPRMFVVAEDAYVTAIGGTSVADYATIYGTLTMPVDTDFTMLGGDLLTVAANGAIATSGVGHVNAFLSDVTIADGTSVTGILEMRNTTLIVTSGTLAATLRPRNQTAGTLTVSSGTEISDLVYSFTAANLLTVAFAGSNEIHGDVTESGATGTMSATGLPVLGGLLDQDIDTPQLDTSALTWGMNKAAGIVTVSNGDFVAGDDWGTVANTGGDYSASTQAADGFIVPVGNTGDVDFNDFDLVLGADGFDASAASGATILLGSGDIVSQGDFLVHASATLTEETATLVMDGGTSGTPLVLDVTGNLTACTVATGAYANTVKANTITTLKVYGDTTQDTTLTATTATFYDGSSTSGTESLNCDTLTIADADTFIRPAQIASCGTLTPTTGTLASAVTAINGAGGFPDPTTIASGSKITDLVFKFDAESAVFPIQMDAGLMDFSITNASNPFWIFPDGTTSTADRPAKTLASAGTVYLFCDDFSASTINVTDNGTDAKYLGDLSDLPALTYYLSLYNCTNVTGALSDLPALTYYLSLLNCTNITGALSDLPALTYFLSLFGCVNVTGDLSDLPPLTNYLSLSGCSLVTGILPATVTATLIYLDNTGLSKTDLEQTLINVESNGSSNGSFDADTGMPTIDNATAIAAVASLRGRDWTVTLAGGV